MEQHNTTHHVERGYQPALDNYDAVPRDGDAASAPMTEQREESTVG